MITKSTNPSLKKKKILINNSQKHEFNTTTTNNDPVSSIPDVANKSNMSTILMKENTLTEDAYIHSLSPKEYKAYLIAKSHLATSFSLKKSNGYLTYVTSITSPP